MNDKKLNELLNRNPNRIQAPALRAAVEELNKRREKQEAEQAISRLSVVADTTAQAVESLRAARRIEAKAKNYLTNVNRAEEKFMKDGDYEAYVKEIQAAHHL